jgi:hypothetical protein
MAWGAVGPMMGLAAILLFVARVLTARQADPRSFRMATTVQT